jgi:hypothetical protein
MKEGIDLQMGNIYFQSFCIVSYIQRLVSLWFQNADWCSGFLRKAFRQSVIKVPLAFSVSEGLNDSGSESLDGNLFNVVFPEMKTFSENCHSSAR